jgi:hypothetical protein
MIKHKTYRYYIPDHGMDSDDPFEFKTVWDDDDLECLARDAAENYWHGLSGSDSAWPITFILILSNGKHEEFLVNMEYEPYFRSKHIPSKSGT